MRESKVVARILTNDREHPRRLGSFSITLVLCLIVKHGLVDDEDVLATLSNDFILLAFPDFTSVSEPADLWKQMKI